MVGQIAARAARLGWRLYFLGAATGVADKAAAILQARYPGLVMAGTFPGSPALGKEDAIVERIRAARPDVLLIDFGAPAQDVWLARNQSPPAGTCRDGRGQGLRFHCRSRPTRAALGSAHWAGDGYIASSASRGAGEGNSHSRVLSGVCCARMITARFGARRVACDSS